MRILTYKTLKNHFSNFLGKEMKIKYKKYFTLLNGNRFTKEKIVGIFVGFDIDNSLRFLDKTGDVKIIKPLFTSPWAIDEIYI